MKRRIAIVDTGFDKSHRKIQEMWDGFDYEIIDLLAGGEYHPHGTLVANFAMRPFDNDDMRGQVKFLHIRAGDVNGRFPSSAIFEAFNIVEERGCTAVNCSWGGPKPGLPIHEEMAERILALADKGVAWHWAAGNEGDYYPDDDMSMPQGLLRRGNGTYSWASMSKQGVPSFYSGDGQKVWMSMWAENRPVHGADGLINSFSGTSGACPLGCGLCEAALSLAWAKDYAELERIFVTEAIHLTKKDDRWVPYRNPETGEKWHPKPGYGSLEHNYQRLTEHARCRPQRVPAAAVRWLNFTRIG